MFFISLPLSVTVSLLRYSTWHRHRKRTFHTTPCFPFTYNEINKSVVNSHRYGNKFAQIRRVVIPTYRFHVTFRVSVFESSFSNPVFWCINHSKFFERGKLEKRTSKFEVMTKNLLLMTPRLQHWRLLSWKICSKIINNRFLSWRLRIRVLYYYFLWTFSSYVNELIFLS